MKLSEPKIITFLIAVVLAVVGLLGQLFIPAWAPFAFWIVLVAFVLLAAGNLIKGL